jgi:hypothetical protein
MVEFRLYYDDTGKVICYTCEQLPGDNYIVIDTQTYAEGRPDLRIVNGEIRRASDFVVVSKLVESSTGIECNYDDVCIIDDTGGKKWKTETYEFRNY